jgi:4-amino-4-deoxy-L-arabinose transferase-like glycosyltransferase
MFDSPPRSSPSLFARGWVQAALTILAGVLAHAIGVDSSGLSQSEAHRAIPGWTMLERGDWIVPHLFEQPYLRKPPGMPWAVALSSSILGPTEFAARMVSAAACVGMALLALSFARRWFGPRFALAAGLAQALTPLFYLHPQGRSAEIEPLHNFFAMAAALMIFDALVRPGSRARAQILGVLTGLALGAMLLTKGPAAVPILVASVLAGLWARWRPRALLTPTLTIGVPLGLALAAAYAIALAREVATLPIEPVVESPTEFLFRDGAWSRILLLAPVSLAGAVPVSLALLVLLLPTPRPDYVVEQRRRATALALACLGALAIYMAFGVSNNRYAMPALTVLAPLASFWLADAHIRLSAPAARRVRIVAACIAGVLLVAIPPYAIWSEARRARNSGEDAGRALAALLPDHAEVWADQVVEQRPEILWYAQRFAAEQRVTIRPRWTPQRPGQPPRLPPPGGFVLVRTDARDDSGEHALITGAPALQGATPLWTTRVQNLGIALYRMPALGSTP